MSEAATAPNFTVRSSQENTPADHELFAPQVFPHLWTSCGLKNGGATSVPFCTEIDGEFAVDKFQALGMLTLPDHSLTLLLHC
jgi:hypothetical protein